MARRTKAARLSASVPTEAVAVTAELQSATGAPIAPVGAWRRSRRDDYDNAIETAYEQGGLDAKQRMSAQAFLILRPRAFRELVDVALERNGVRGDKPTLEELIAAIMTIIAFIQALFDNQALLGE